MPYHAFRPLLILWALLLAAAGFSQTNTNIVVPKSSVRKPVDSLHTAHTNYSVYVGPWTRPSIDDPQPLMASHGPVVLGTIPGYHPADIQAAYKVPINNGTKAIAIIDAYHLPTALNDFNVFSAAFGLPQETSTNPNASTNQVLQVIYASGTKPATDGGWGGEIALDIEWAHAMAPKAKIYLIECASPSLNDLMVGVRYAATQLPDVWQVSMSFGTLEFQGESQFDTNFTATNKVFYASSGDNSNEVNYPAVSPNVIGVGGTKLLLNAGAVVSETAWADGGGGPSRFISRPAFQNSVSNVVGNFRGTPDIAAIGDPQTGVAIYDSTPIPDAGSGWLVFGGTSLSAPVCAGMANARGNFSTSTNAELLRQYGGLGTANLRDVTSGTSGLHTAAPGYDFCTGVGVPLGTSISGTNKSFSPTAIAVVSGVAVQGVPANMVAKDEHDYVVRSIASGGQQVVSVGGTFALNLGSNTTVTSGNVSITGLATNTSDQLSLLNVKTGAWDNISSLNFSAANKTLAAAVTSINDYIAANGTVKFRVSGSGSAAIQIRLGIDQIQLNLATTTTTP